MDRDKLDRFLFDARFILIENLVLKLDIVVEALLSQQRSPLPIAQASMASSKALETSAATVEATLLAMRAGSAEERVLLADEFREIVEAMKQKIADLGGTD